MKKFLLYLCLFFLLTQPTIFANKKLNPYQDYIFVVIHGINDYKNSFDGTNEEWSKEKRERLNLLNYCIDSLDIPKQHIYAYSFSQNRASSIQNALELGYPGIKVPLDNKSHSNIKPLVNYDFFSHQIDSFLDDNKAVIGAGVGIAIGAFDNVEKPMDASNTTQFLGNELAKDWPFIMFAGAYGATAGEILGPGAGNTLKSISEFNQLFGEMNAYEGWNPKRERNEIFAYLPALNNHFETGIEWGHSFLEQAFKIIIRKCQ